MVKYMIPFLAVAAMAACTSNQPADSNLPAEPLNFETAAQELCNLKCSLRSLRAEGDKEKFRQGRMNLKRLMDAVDELQEAGEAKRLLEDCKCD